MSPSRRGKMGEASMSTMEATITILEADEDPLEAMGPTLKVFIERVAQQLR